MDAAPDAFIKAMGGDDGAPSASNGGMGAGLGNTAGVMSFKFLTATHVSFVSPRKKPRCAPYNTEISVWKKPSM